MTKIPDRAESVARQVVQEIAPDEAPLFDQLWGDFRGKPRTDRIVGAEAHGGGPHGFGAEESATFLWTAVVIPVVVAVLAEEVKPGVDWIINRTKTMITGKSGKPAPTKEVGEKIGEVAKAVEKQASPGGSPAPFPPSPPTEGRP